MRNSFSIRYSSTGEEFLHILLSHGIVLWGRLYSSTFFSFRNDYPIVGGGSFYVWIKVLIMRCFKGETDCPLHNPESLATNTKSGTSSPNKRMKKIYQNIVSKFDNFCNLSLIPKDQGTDFKPEIDRDRNYMR